MSDEYSLHGKFLLGQISAAEYERRLKRLRDAEDRADLERKLRVSELIAHGPGPTAYNPLCYERPPGLRAMPSAWHRPPVPLSGGSLEQEEGDGGL
jgi:hypothetical protein